MATENKETKFSELGLITQFTGKEIVPMAYLGTNPAATLEALKTYMSDSALQFFAHVVGTSVTLNDTTPDMTEGRFAIVYLTQHRTFALEKTVSGASSYYTKFAGADNYLVHGTTEVRTDRVFFCASDKQMYTYNGTSLSQLSIDSIGTPKFYVIMDISSESAWGTSESIITSPIADYRIVFDTSSHRFGYAGPWSGSMPSVNLVFYPYFDFEGISYKMYEYSPYVKKSFIRDGGAQYTWNTDGTGLMSEFSGIHVLTEEELENLQNPIEGAIYATLE